MPLVLLKLAEALVMRAWLARVLGHAATVSDCESQLIQLPVSLSRLNALKARYNWDQE